EIAHANEFIDHLLDRDHHPALGPTSAPEIESGSVLVTFETALEHDRKVSESIRSLYRACETAGDLDSRPLLSWFPRGVRSASGPNHGEHRREVRGSAP
ncbi:MAG: ferritin-like domain-containing protein, partial [Dermatophilaceae bacterium]